MFGLAGLSCFVVSINITLYKFIIHKSKISFLQLIFVVILPIFLSFFIEGQVSRKKNKTTNIQIVAINTSFAGLSKYKLSPAGLINKQINLSIPCVDSNFSTIVLWPESSIINEISTKKINNSYASKLLKTKMIKNNSSVIAGAILTNGKHKYTGVIHFKYDTTDFRVKEKLVPFNEYFPFSKTNAPKWLKKILYTGIFDFSMYPNSKTFVTHNTKIGSFICFESFFGDFVRKLVSTNKANIITIGLNEGWYKNKGYKLSEAHAIARAIENRKPVIKSSNEGFSTYIDYYGNIIKTIKQEGCIKISPEFIDKSTFYQKKGDWLPKILLICFIIYFTFFLLKKYFQVFFIGTYH